MQPAAAASGTAKVVRASPVRAGRLVAVVRHPPRCTSSGFPEARIATINASATGASRTLECLAIAARPTAAAAAASVRPVTWLSTCQSDQAASVKQTAPHTSLVASGPWATTAGQKAARASDTTPPPKPKSDRDQRKMERHKATDHAMEAQRAEATRRFAETSDR